MTDETMLKLNEACKKQNIELKDIPFLLDKFQEFLEDERGLTLRDLVEY